MAFKLLDENIIKIISVGYEIFRQKISPITMVKDSPNPGNKIYSNETGCKVE
jgi:hypothetical protein